MSTHCDNSALLIKHIRVPRQLYRLALIELTWPVQHHRCPSAVNVRGAETFLLDWQTALIVRQ